VRAAGFGYGGAAVFSAGSDKTLRLFNAETASEFELGVQFPLPVYAMAVIPPGDAVAAASGSTISVLDLARAGRYVEQQRQVDAAVQTLQSNANDRAALLTLGRWYAFRGIDDWASTTLEDARYAGADVPALRLAQSYWRMNRNADAAREFRRAIERNEAPVPYLQLCIAAAENPPTTQPSTQSTR
jgi:hypothetical protein